MTKTAWFHCFAGTAGDMTLASLVHAGADPVAVAEIVARLPVDNYALSFEPTMRCGLAATRAIVAVDHHEHGHDTTITTTGIGRMRRFATCWLRRIFPSVFAIARRRRS